MRADRPDRPDTAVRPVRAASLFGTLHRPITASFSVFPVGLGCLRLQSTLRTRLKTNVPSVRCTTAVVPLAQCIHPLEPVYLSTPPTPPTPSSLTLMAVHKAASPTRTLSHTRCTLAAHSLRTYASSSPGLWAKCLRWYAINAHDSSCIRNTDGNPVRYPSCIPTNHKKKLLPAPASRDGEFSFLVWLQTTGATGSPPRK